MTYHDLENSTYNYLTIIGFDAMRDNYLICECKCGSLKSIYKWHILREKTKSCGCLMKTASAWRFRDLLGQRFGRLVVVEIVEERQNEKIMWKCLCDCGTEKIICGTHLKNGHAQSCGCFRSEVSAARFSAYAKGLIGPKHPNWKGGVLRSERYNQRNMYVRTQCLRRDKHTCQICNNKKKNMIAHHIFGYSGNMDGRLDLLNLITMCYNCHKFFHSAYGNNVGDLELADFIDKRHAYDTEW